MSFLAEPNHKDRRWLRIFLVFMVDPYKLFQSHSGDSGRRNTEEPEGSGNLQSGSLSKRILKREERGFCPGS